MRKKNNVTVFESKMIAEYEKIAKKKHIQMSDRSKIQILLTSPKNKECCKTLFIIPGFGSIVLGWDEFLMRAKDYFNIVYFETREKKSSELSKKADYSIDRISSDIREVVEELRIKKEDLVIFCSSFGAITTAHALAQKKIDPFLTVFVGPPYKIDMPPLSKYLIFITPAVLFRLFTPVGTWWIKKRKSESPEQAAKYLRVIQEADPKKWKKYTQEVAFKTYWHLYEKIEGKALVIDESEDKMHKTKVTQRIADSMKNAEYVDLKTNKYTHSADTADFLLQKISSSPPSGYCNTSYFLRFYLMTFC